MRIRWNPVEVMDAADELEGYVDKIIKPLEQAKAAAERALKIARLPEYVTYRLNAFVSEVLRTIGGVEQTSWRDGSKYITQGMLKNRIADIRKEVPEDALKEARAKLELL